MFPWSLMVDYTPEGRQYHLMQSTIIQQFFERFVIKLVKPASVTTANDIPANHNVILISVE